MSSPKGSKFVGRSASLSFVLGFTGVVLLFVVGGTTTYFNVRTINLDTALVTDTHRMLREIDSILALLKDAERGQRGFVLTGNEHYLEPYSSALSRMQLTLSELKQLAADNSLQLDRIPSIETDIKIKLDDLERTIETRRTQGFEAALDIVNTDAGKSAMDRISTALGVVADIELRSRSERLAEMENAFRVAVISAVTSSFVGVLLTFVVAGFAKRAMRNRARQAWLQSGHIGLANALVGDPKVKDLGESALGFLSDYLDAQAGAFFVRDGTSYRRVSTYGVPEGGVPSKELTLDDLLANQDYEVPADFNPQRIGHAQTLQSSSHLRKERIQNRTTVDKELDAQVDIDREQVHEALRLRLRDVEKKLLRKLGRSVRQIVIQAAQSRIPALRSSSTKQQLRL